MFDNISCDRSLVVMGYSGSDDFDIVPTLKVIKGLRNLIWINHVNDDKGKEVIHEIDESTRLKEDPLVSDPMQHDLKEGKTETKMNKNMDDAFARAQRKLNNFLTSGLDNLVLEKGMKNKEKERTEIEATKINKMLIEIYRNQNAKQVYRVDVNTTRMVEELGNINRYADIKNNPMTPQQWLEKVVPEPSKFVQHVIPFELYMELNMIKDATRCCKEMLAISKQLKEEKWREEALNNMGVIFFKRATTHELRWQEGDYHYQETEPLLEEALKKFKEALDIAERIEDFQNKVSFLNNIGGIFQY
ncbi:MAG: hypothetical protein ACFE8P_14200, partial [Promethearchaeota archaeon]